MYPRIRTTQLSYLTCGAGIPIPVCDCNYHQNHRLSGYGNLLLMAHRVY